MALSNGIWQWLPRWRLPVHLDLNQRLTQAQAIGGHATLPRGVKQKQDRFQLLKTYYNDIKSYFKCI